MDGNLAYWKETRGRERRAREDEEEDSGADDDSDGGDGGYDEEEGEGEEYDASSSPESEPTGHVETTRRGGKRWAEDDWQRVPHLTWDGAGSFDVWAGDVKVTLPVGEPQRRDEELPEGGNSEEGRSEGEAIDQDGDLPRPFDEESGKREEGPGSGEFRETVEGQASEAERARLRTSYANKAKDAVEKRDRLVRDLGQMLGEVTQRARRYVEFGDEDPDWLAKTNQGLQDWLHEYTGFLEEVDGLSLLEEDYLDAGGVVGDLPQERPGGEIRGEEEFGAQFPRAALAVMMEWTRLRRAEGFSHLGEIDFTDSFGEEARRQRLREPAVVDDGKGTGTGALDRETRGRSGEEGWGGQGGADRLPDHGERQW
jgi:hypothetical protein